MSLHLQRWNNCYLCFYSKRLVLQCQMLKLMRLYSCIILKINKDHEYYSWYEDWNESWIMEITFIKISIAIIMMMCWKQNEQPPSCFLWAMFPVCLACFQMKYFKYHINCFSGEFICYQVIFVTNCKHIRSAFFFRIVFIHLLTTVSVANRDTVSAARIM